VGSEMCIRDSGFTAHAFARSGCAFSFKYGHELHG
jgi:hypothetical protein